MKYYSVLQKLGIKLYNIDTVQLRIYNTYDSVHSNVEYCTRQEVVNNTID